MHKANRNLVILIGLTAVIVTGAVIENVRSAIKPAETETAIEVRPENIDRTRTKLLESGLKPREAMYWKEL